LTQSALAASAAPQLGADVSYPQCGQALPAIGAFAVVGVNSGRPFGANPCLGSGSGVSELLWAGIGAQLYTNTADPGPALSSHWPNGQTAPQPCNTPAAPGTDTPTCAYDYGWNAAQDSYRNAVNAYISLGWAPMGATSTPVANNWWLDVESANSWEANTQNNIAELQGEFDYLKSAGAASVGFYSPASNWQTITGGTSAFATAPAWAPGASSQTDAQARCSAAGASGGPTMLVQFSSTSGTADLSCVPLPALTFSADSPSKVGVGKPSRPIVVVLPQAAAAPTLVAFTSSTSGGNFATATSGPWSPSLVVTVSAGAARAPAVFFKDGTKETTVIAATAAGDATATRAIKAGQGTSCTGSANVDRGYELALAHTKTRASATRLVSQTDAALRGSGRHAVIERDSCTDFELAVRGYRTLTVARVALHRLRQRFASATLEKT
jgi:hypothetical protein